jgi:hypothetical protein
VNIADKVVRAEVWPNHSKIESRIYAGDYFMATLARADVCEHRIEAI